MKLNFEKHNLNINASHSGYRLDKYLQEIFPEFSRSFIQNQIHSNHVLVNNRWQKCGYQLKPNDTVLIDFQPRKTDSVKPENIDLDIIYEDSELLVVNKPAGMVVHPGSGNYSGTLVNGLVYYCNSLSNINGSLRPGIVHRLDKNTSGLLVIAKTDSSHLFLQNQFISRDIKRTYRAIVWGRPAQHSGFIETKIARSTRDRKKMTTSSERGKLAKTYYKIVNDFQYISELELNLMTGRTHQIRVHLNYLGYPVFGDADYNGRSSQLKRLPSYLQKEAAVILKNMNRQALHAKKLSFIHPYSKNLMEFESNLPPDYVNALKQIKNMFI